MNGRVVPVGELPDHGPPSIDMPVPPRALAIGAHPDDIEFGCGATLAKWADAGCEVDYLVLTDGSKGSWEDGTDRSALVGTRQEEQRRAASVIGVRDVAFLGLVDGELQSGLDERRSVCAAIRNSRPDVVLAHDPWRRYRLHPDHRHAGWLAVDGVVAARDPLFFPDLHLPAHRPQAILLWEADEPNHVEEVADTVDRKLQALAAHRSQQRTTMGIEPGQDEEAGRQRFADGVRAQLSRHGTVAGVALGEAFHLLTEI